MKYEAEVKKRAFHPEKLVFWQKGGRTLLSKRLKERARALGLAPVGITSAEPLLEVRQVLEGRAQSGEVTPFVSADIVLRTDPRKVWPEARAVILVGLPYAVAPAPPPHSLRGYVAAGAAGRDYHHVLRDKLRELAAFLEAEVPGAQSRLFVDTGPLIERPFAWRAGLGVWGESTALLNPQGGPAFFLGGLLINRPLQADVPQTGSCLRCGRCRRACPTGALVEPFRVKPAKCLSYLTQARVALPPALRPLLGNRLYGCDACLAACPLIEKAPQAGAEIALPEFLTLSRREFAHRYGETAMAWRGRTVLQRNAAYVLGNLGDPAAIPVLTTLLTDPRPALRAAAVWSLGCLGGRKARAALERQLKWDNDAAVQAEITRALT